MQKHTMGDMSHCEVQSSVTFSSASRSFRAATCAGCTAERGQYTLSILKPQRTPVQA